MEKQIDLVSMSTAELQALAEQIAKEVRAREAMSFDALQKAWNTAKVEIPERRIMMVVNVEGVQKRFYTTVRGVSFSSVM